MNYEQDYYNNYLQFKSTFTFDEGNPLWEHYSFARDPYENNIYYQFDPFFNFVSIPDLRELTKVNAHLDKPLHYPSSPDIVICEKCGKEFKTNTAKKAHMIAKHYLSTTTEPEKPSEINFQKIGSRYGISIMDLITLDRFLSTVYQNEYIYHPNDDDNDKSDDQTKYASLKKENDVNLVLLKTFPQQLKEALILFFIVNRRVFFSIHHAVYRYIRYIWKRDKTPNETIIIDKIKLFLTAFSENNTNFIFDMNTCCSQSPITIGTEIKIYRPTYITQFCYKVIFYWYFVMDNGYELFLKFLDKRSGVNLRADLYEYLFKGICELELPKLYECMKIILMEEYYFRTDCSKARGITMQHLWCDGTGFLSTTCEILGKLTYYNYNLLDDKDVLNVLPENEKPLILEKVCKYTKRHKLIENSH